MDKAEVKNGDFLSIECRYIGCRETVGKKQVKVY